ncbi:MAG TPA: hypothetical protein VJC05_04395 [Candidatus Andersenbacteria bacterium]|nr:MAG: hypothetical protein A2854_04755 [Parcubacteria group bacterium RIFCSPHIGHO2_01_FULL_56_18]HLD26253.1 hypothetical protein [Candidatus Andersenbacteria bacterium]
MNVAAARKWLRDLYSRIVYGGTEEELDREQAERKKLQRQRDKESLDKTIAEEGPRVLERIRAAEAEALKRKLRPSDN